MPPASQSPIGTTSQGSILLIEEYDALASAITSALRKFAPHHATHVARSLSEAKTIARKIAPSLIVIDFDPAFPGLSAFLQKMQASYPDARVLVIAGKIPREIAAESRSIGALQFVGKPFDVPDFGAAVQALLGPWTESETARPRGTLVSLGLPDVLLAQSAGARTVAMEIKNDAGKAGEIHLRQGVVAHAEAGKKSGPEALREMLAWSDIEVREREKPRASRRTVDGGWMELVIEAFQIAKARQAPPPVKDVPPKPHHKTGKKIVAVDDTEMLLIFVEDVLMTADPELQITTAPSGISGIEEIARIKPDLVLLDYSLPDINGDEVCRRLLQDKLTAQIPILMMSGHLPEMSKAAATLDNVVATLPKPFLSEALISLVHEVLSEPRLPRKKTVPSRKSVEPSITPAPSPRVPAREKEAEPAVESLAKNRTTSLPKEPSRKIEPPPRQVQQPPPPPAAPAPPPPPPPPPVLPPATVRPSRKAGAFLPEVPTSGVSGSAAMVPPSTNHGTEDGKEKAATTVQAPPAEPVTPIHLPPKPVAPEETKIPPREVFSMPVVSEGPNEVILGLFLDVVSVQLTPDLRMGAIRAKPSSTEVSLDVVSAAMRATLPANGFQLGPVGVDGKGRIATIRLIPTLVPFKAGQTRNSLQIGGVSVVPIDSTERVQLTPAPGAPMTMQLLAHLELAGVELSSSFQVSQLVLKNRGNKVRVTLNSHGAGQEETGATCEILSVRLDHSGKIVELLLNPIR